MCQLWSEERLYLARKIIYQHNYWYDIKIILLRIFYYKNNKLYFFFENFWLFRANLISDRLIKTRSNRLFCVPSQCSDFMGTKCTFIVKYFCWDVFILYYINNLWNIIDCFPSRFVHLIVTKLTTYENYAGCHKIKTKYIHCCWDVPDNFNAPTTFSGISGTLSRTSVWYKWRNRRFTDITARHFIHYSRIWNKKKIKDIW